VCKTDRSVTLTKLSDKYFYNLFIDIIADCFGNIRLWFLHSYEIGIMVCNECVLNNVYDILSPQDTDMTCHKIASYTVPQLEVGEMSGCQGHSKII
jgi:hypothetical protein